MTEATKHCNKCDEDWPRDLEFFFSDPGSKDGLFYCCKACFRESVKDHRRLVAPGRGPHATDAIAPLLTNGRFFQV